jgi:hypothetical protein
MATFRQRNCEKNNTPEQNKLFNFVISDDYDDNY